MSKDILKSLIGILIGVVFMYMTLRDQPLEDTINNLKTVNMIWIIISGFVLGLIFVFRSLRWNVMLDNMGYKIKNTHIIYYTLYGYLINTFTPKFGEVLRCTALAKDADIPVSSSLGSVIMERVYDVVVLLLGLIIIAVLELDRLSHLLNQAYDFVHELLIDSSTKLLIASLIFVISLIVTVYILKRIKLFAKVKNFLNELLSSIIASIKMKQFPIFIFYTMIIWSLLALINYIFLLAIPETETLNIYIAVVILFVGGIGWALPSPNGIGTTHYIILQLFLVFGLPESGAVTFGILSNGILLIYTVLYGVGAISVKMLSSHWNPLKQHI